MDTIFINRFTDDESKIRQKLICAIHNVKLVVVKTDDDRTNWICPECDKVSIHGWFLK